VAKFPHSPVDSTRHTEDQPPPLIKLENFELCDSDEATHPLHSERADTIPESNEVIKCVL